MDGSDKIGLDFCRQYVCKNQIFPVKFRQRIVCEHIKHHQLVGKNNNNNYVIVYKHWKIKQIIIHKF